MEKYVIINTSDVTSEMKNSSTIDATLSYDKSLTILAHKADKPSCFDVYESLDKDTWYQKYYRDEYEIWNGPSPV